MVSRKVWNWQQDDWPYFSYASHKLLDYEQKFLQQSGVSFGISKHINPEDQKNLIIDLLSNEALKTSEIEGEILDRDSLQSSIRKHFGLQTPSIKSRPAENGIAEMMMDVHHHFDAPLSHEVLWSWHKMLMNGRQDLQNLGSYRTHTEPMQVVSGYIHDPKIHFEAPPSDTVHAEMDRFITWFNDTSPSGKAPLSPLIRSGLAHLYFVCIHPFEDGNGRIGRALVEKVLAQHLKQPTLIALSQVINDHRKLYYDALEAQNKHNEVTNFLTYFAQTLLDAQDYTLLQMEFIIKKTKFFEHFKNQLNTRQLKAVERIFHEGLKGFKGGLSAHNYIAITKTSASTATRDLHDLVEKKILTQTGSLKATRYWLSLD